MESKLPFKEYKISDNTIIRYFSTSVEEKELEWHWDEEDRWVDPINKNDWQFQFDNELPQKINKQIYIPAGAIHRVIRGNTDLIVKIEKVR